MRPPLELLQGPLDVGAEASVDRGVREPVPGERELQLGDVPTAHAGRERPRAERVPRETTEGTARLGPGDAIRHQAVPTLETHHGGGRPRPHKPGYRAPGEWFGAGRHLGA